MPPLAYNETSGLNLAEQLFTARGSQSIAMGTHMKTRADLDPSDWQSTAGLYSVTQPSIDPNNKFQMHTVRSQWNFKVFP